MHVKKKELPKLSEFTMTAEDAAKIVGCSPKTLIRYAIKGRISYARDDDNDRSPYMFRKIDVQSFSERRGPKVFLANEQTEDDREISNPAVAEFIDTNKRMFATWTEDELDELYSWQGVGGALTKEGVKEKVDHINWKRKVLNHVEAILESNQAESFSKIVEAIYKDTIKQQQRP